MMRNAMRAALLVAIALLAGGGGVAALEDKPRKPADARPEAPVPAEPSETSASFGDWVVRCQRVGQAAAGTRVCEAAQSLLVKGQQAPIAQIAFGHAGTAETMLTVLLPINLSFDKPPALGMDEAHMNTLTFRRCVPAGCLASVKMDAAALHDLREAKGPGRLVFTDAAERTLTLPVSFRGLPQALDDLAKER